VSPDDLLQLTDAYGGGVCCVEYKTCMSLKPDAFEATHVVNVEAGDQAYLDRIPIRFRKQLLHQVAILGVKCAMLVLGGPKGATSVSLIRYSEEDIEEYLTLLRDQVLKDVYGWFHDHVLLDDNDKLLASRMPASTPAPVRALLESHIPFIAAVLRYRARICRHVEPTKLFRAGIINAYDLGKTPTDTVCGIVADLMAGRTSALRWRQLIALRYYYFALIATSNLIGFYSWYKKNGADPSGQSLHQVRAAWRTAQGPATTRIKNIAVDLFRNRAALRRTSPQKGLLMVPSTPRPGLDPSGLVCARPDDVFDYIRRRSLEKKQTLSEAQLMYGLPLSDSGLNSSDSPFRPVIREKDAEKWRPAAGAFSENLARLRTKIHAKTREQFWKSEWGTMIRSTPFLLHLSIPCTLERASCFVCKGYVRTAVTDCGLCGVRTCADCWNVFHSASINWGDLKPDVQEAAVESGVSAAAPAMPAVPLPAPLDSESPKAVPKTVNRRHAPAKKPKLDS
jgi:hypothetical protein